MTFDEVYNKLMNMKDSDRRKIHSFDAVNNSRNVLIHRRGDFETWFIVYPHIVIEKYRRYPEEIFYSRIEFADKFKYIADFEYFNTDVVFGAGYLTFQPEECCGYESFMKIMNELCQDNDNIYRASRIAGTNESIIITFKGSSAKIQISTIKDITKSNMFRKENGLQVYPFDTSFYNDISLYMMLIDEIYSVKSLDAFFSSGAAIKSIFSSVDFRYLENKIIKSKENSVTDIKVDALRIKRPIFY